MRRVPAISWLIAHLVVATLLPAQAARAHAQFTGSDPASDASLENSPHEIVLTFSQAVTPVSVALAGPDGVLVETVDEAIANGARVVVPVTAPLSAGTYVVSFRVLAGDAHAISGSFRFSMTPPSGQFEESVPIAAGDDASAPASTSPSSSPVSDPMPSDTAEKVFRLAFMLALLLAVGLVVFRLGIALPGSLDAWVVKLTRRTAYMGLVLAAAYFLVATLAATGLDGFRPRHLYVMLQTSIGMSLLVAVAGFMVLSVSGPDERRILGSIGAVALAASRILTGHPASQEPMLILVPAMAVHVGAAAFWFASLWILLRFLRKGPLADAQQILGAFARMALWSVSALLVVGLAMAIVHVKSADALIDSDYGSLLLWKLGGVAGLLVLAAVNKLWLTPDLLVRFDARRLKASIRIEALLMILVIAISTLLAATPPVARADVPVTLSAPYDEAQPLFDRERVAFNREGPFER